MRLSAILISLGLFSLGACDPYPPTLTPDYTIRVMPSQNGLVAVPPTCPSWATDVTDPYDNQPVPQYGCANARNLALMAEKPEDLVHGRDLDDTRGVVMVGTIRRYDNNQTRGLLYTTATPDSSVDATTATTPTSSMSGDVTGSASSSSSSSSPSSSSSSSSSGP
jgi:hypothetical protein